MKKRLKPLIPFAILAIAAVIELVLSNFVYFAFVAGKNHVKDYCPDLQTVTATGDDTQFSFGISAFQLNSVAFTVKAADENVEPFEITVSIYADDEGVTNSFNLLASKKVAVSASEKTSDISPITIFSEGYQSYSIEDKIEIAKKIFPEGALCNYSSIASLLERLKRPFSSVPRNLTLILSPTLHTSSTFSVRFLSSLEM